MSLNVGQVLQEMIRKEGKEKHRVDSPFLPCQIPTGYESVDQEKRLIAHFSAPGLRRAVIKILLIFGHEAIKMVMGAGGVASERVLATVTALVSLNLFTRLLIQLIVFIATLGSYPASRREHNYGYLQGVGH